MALEELTLVFSLFLGIVMMAVCFWMEFSNRKTERRLLRLEVELMRLRGQDVERIDAVQRMRIERDEWEAEQKASAAPRTAP